MFSVTLQNNRLNFGKHFGISFQRTVRVPDDGRDFALPSSLGSLPIFSIADYINTVPFKWLINGCGVFIPMYQSEAMWINFHYPHWHPHCLKIGAGGINIVDGKTFDDKLVKGRSDYLVCPSQSWIDGFNAGGGKVRQFVAAPLGHGLTVEAKITGKESKGGLQIVVFPPKEGLFPDRDPNYQPGVLYQCNSISEPVEMGLGSGGFIIQKIYPDQYGIDTWNQENCARIEVHIINSAMFKQITGKKPPETPISYHMYKELGIPWHKIYDEELEFIDTEDFLA